MHLKTKVQRILIMAGCAILFCLIGYAVYFIVNDTLMPPPENILTKNLFIEKDSIDIENLKNKASLNKCRELYYSILNSINEEKLNGFLGVNLKDNNKKYDSLCNSLNEAFLGRFIFLAKEYFLQPDWNFNNIVSECISEIKTFYFVEPIWALLIQNFENNIIWYDSTQNCISSINNVIYWKTYFSSNNLSELTRIKNNLISQNCTKNNNKLSELRTAYGSLKNMSLEYLFAKINEYDSFFEYSDKYNYKKTAYLRYNELHSEVEQWNIVFGTNTVLNNQLQKHKDKIDIYYNFRN